MTLNEYQEKAMTTCMDTCRNYSYMFDNLVGEVGEFASKVAKMKRKGEIEIVNGEIIPQMSMVAWTSEQDALMKEAGDILWQLAGLCEVMGWRLNDVAEMNLTKLASRAARGVIDGNGDYR